MFNKLRICLFQRMLKGLPAKDGLPYIFAAVATMQMLGWKDPPPSTLFRQLYSKVNNIYPSCYEYR